MEGLLTVVEVCRRTGLTRKALRIYDTMGLVEPATRSPSGYRLYDDEALRRIEFVRKAKLLGLSLAEAKEFLHVGEGCCGENHPRLGALVEGKLTETEQRIAELQSLRGTLRSVLERLSSRSDGGHRCDEALCMCAGPVPIERR
jgi:MerR family Zn(II)-responsive transcriptional regulator of zntA